MHKLRQFSYHRLPRLMLGLALLIIFYSTFLSSSLLAQEAKESGRVANSIKERSVDKKRNKQKTITNAV